MDIKKLFLIVILLLAVSPLCAAVRVIARAPETVAQGEQFRLEYEVNTQDVKSAQVLTKIPGFEILYGPSRSSSYSVQIINGHQSSVSSVTYGYTLMARKPGTYVIPHITVNVDGHSYASNSVRIKVVPGSGGSSSGNASQGGSPSQ